MKALTVTLGILLTLSLTSCDIYCDSDYDCPEDCYCVDGVCELEPEGYDDDYYEEDN